jgi:hypothetical protein
VNLWIVVVEAHRPRRSNHANFPRSTQGWGGWRQLPCPAGRPRPRPGASRFACAFLVYVLSPLPRRSHRRYWFAHPSRDVSLPRKGRRVGLCNVNFEACSAFTRVTARTLALPPMRSTLTRRLQTFRHLYACSGCFRLERLPGGACARWKAPPFHGAHPSATFTAPNSSAKTGRNPFASSNAMS